MGAWRVRDVRGGRREEVWEWRVKDVGGGRMREKEGGWRVKDMGGGWRRDEVGWWKVKEKEVKEEYKIRKEMEGYGVKEVGV